MKNSKKNAANQTENENFDTFKEKQASSSANQLDTEQASNQDLWTLDPREFRNV